MKRLLILTGLVFLLSVGSAEASPIHWSANYNIVESIGLAHSLSSKTAATNPNENSPLAGMYIGTMAELRNSSGVKMIGFVGFEFFGTAQTDNTGTSQQQAYRLGGAFVPVSFFDDIVQPFYGWQSGQKKGGGIVGISLSLTQAAKLLTSGLNTVTK